jgi:hypothetical protein
VLVAILLSATGCPRKPTPSRAPEPSEPPIAESPLPLSGTPTFEIGDIDWKRSEDDRELFVEGTVKNTGTRPSRDVKVWVDGLDVNGIRLARTEVLPTPQEIPPGGAGKFIVRMPNDPAIRTFHVEAIGR